VNSETRKVTQVVICGSLLIISIVVYMPIASVYFLADDFAALGKMISRGDLIFSFSYFFRPVTLLSLWLSTKLYGTEAIYFHLENVLLHGVNAVLVYFFLLKVLIRAGKSYSQALWPSVTAGLFFALLPSHSEAVIWIVARADLLATFFALCCLYYYVEWLETNKKIFLIGFCTALVLALCSKESAFAIPLLLAVVTVYHLYSFGNYRLFQSKYIIPTFCAVVILIIYFLARRIVIGEIVGGYRGENFSLDVYERNLFFYTLRTVIPPISSQDLLYKISLYRTHLQYLLFIALAILVLLPKWRAVKLLIIGLALFSVLPVLHRPVALHLLSDERYLYLPTAFSCMFLALCLWQLLLSNRYLYAVLVLLLGFYFYGALQHSNALWVKSSSFVVKTLGEIEKHYDPEKDTKLVTVGLPALIEGVQAFNQGFPQAVSDFKGKGIEWGDLYNAAPLYIRGSHVSLEMSYKEDEIQVNIKSEKTDFWPSDLPDDWLMIEPPQKVTKSVSILPKDAESFEHAKVFVYCGESMKLLDECPEWKTNRNLLE